MKFFKLVSLIVVASTFQNIFAQESAHKNNEAVKPLPLIENFPAGYYGVRAWKRIGENLVLLPNIFECKNFVSRYSGKHYYLNGKLKSSDCPAGLVEIVVPDFFLPNE